MTELELVRFRYNGRELKASGLLEVDWNLLAIGAILFFQVSDQSPPEPLERQSGYDRTFQFVSRERFCGAVKLRIQWITANYDTVLLMGNRYETKTDSKEIYRHVKDVCRIEEFEKSFETLANLPDDWVPSTEANATHPLGVIDSVAKRLRSVEWLLSLGFKDTHMPGGPGTWALFILCTCIESLGRSKPFAEYGDWLKKRETLNEVTDAISQAKGKDNCQKFLSDVLEEYKRLYGFRRAFRNFFETKLDQNIRNEVVSTIHVWRNYPPTFEPKSSSSLEELINYLEELRNSFAHDFESLYNAYTQKQIAELPGNRNENDQTVWYFTNQITLPSGAFETVETKALPETLLKAVRFGLWRWMFEKSI